MHTLFNRNLAPLNLTSSTLLGLRQDQDENKSTIYQIEE